MNDYYVSDYSSNNVGKPYFQSPVARFDAEPTEGSFIPPQGPLMGPPYNQLHRQGDDGGREIPIESHDHRDVHDVRSLQSERPHHSSSKKEQMKSDDHKSGLVPDHRRHIYNTSPFDVDYREFLKRLLKYVIEGLAIGIVAFVVFKSKLNWKEAGMIGLTAGFAYCILDTFSPSVSFGARFGTGFGLGQAMIGIPH